MLDWIRTNNINIIIDNIDDYEFVDNELTVSEVPSDQEILLSIKKTTIDDVSDEGESCVQHVSSVQALSALQTLSTFFETNKFEDGYFEHYAKLKNIVSDYHLKNNTAKRQSSILQYFNRQTSC